MRVKLMKICFILTGIFLLVCFLLPVLLKGIVNIGNITGLFLAVLLIGYGIYMKNINQWLRYMWNTVYGKVVFGFLGVMCIIAVAMTGIFSYHMYQSASQKPTQSTTVVVLGCRVYGQTPSLALEERLEAAYHYLKDNPDIKCVVSGGQGKNEDISEAKCMYTYLVEKGIAQERIYMEDQSTSTRENLLFSKEVIEKNDLPKAITIITNEFHQYRARLIGEDLGLEVYAVSAKTAWWLFPTYYVRELFGILYQLIF